jgi:hypothetical protein
VKSAAMGIPIYLCPDRCRNGSTDWPVCKFTEPAPRAWPPWPGPLDATGRGCIEMPGPGPGAKILNPSRTIGTFSDACPGKGKNGPSLREGGRFWQGHWMVPCVYEARFFPPPAKACETNG